MDEKTHFQITCKYRIIQDQMVNLRKHLITVVGSFSMIDIFRNIFAFEWKHPYINKHKIPKMMNKEF